MARKHDERCRKCKNMVGEFLRHIYGEVSEQYDLNLPADVEDYKDARFYKDLQKIHAALQDHRGFLQFTKARRLPAVDCFVAEPGFIVEFDESQHFTEPRKIALQEYPVALRLGFPKDKWMDRCATLHKKDNDPPYRDEQRAWYDTLRDFGSVLRQIPLIRMRPDERVWCELKVNNDADVERFKHFVESRLHQWQGEQRTLGPACG